MSLWSKIGWRHWLSKHLDHLKAHSALRIWCWIIRSFNNDRAQIQFWINCWLQSRLTHKHGLRLTDNGWTPVPAENRGCEGSVLCNIPKANLSDVTADADSWLKMTVQWWWFQTHCSEIRAHLKRVSPAFFPGDWSLKRLFLYGSSALIPCLPDYVVNALYNHLPHQVKRERHYKVYTRTSASSRVSPRAACSSGESLMMN